LEENAVKIKKLLSNVKLLEGNMKTIGKKRVTVKGDNTVPKKAAKKTETEKEYIELRRKYQKLLAKYKQLKMKQEVRSNVEKVREKFKSIETQFKTFKHTDKMTKNKDNLRGKILKQNIKKPKKLISRNKDSISGGSSKVSEAVKKKSQRNVQLDRIDRKKLAKQGEEIKIKSKIEVKSSIEINGPPSKRLRVNSISKKIIFKCELCKRIFALESGLKKHSSRCPERLKRM